MSDGALRGSRLGATSYETDHHVEFAPRQPVSYDCPNGHVTTMPFSLEADVPLVWECRCGSEALLRDGDQLFAQLPDMGTTAELVVINAAGGVVQRTRISGDRTVIDLASLSSGLYTVQVLGVAGLAPVRFVKD